MGRIGHPAFEDTKTVRRRYQRLVEILSPEEPSPRADFHACAQTRHLGNGLHIIQHRTRDIPHKSLVERVILMSHQLNLPAPFPASPTRPPVYGFFTYNADRIQFHNFAAAYAAKKFLDFMIQGHDYKWTETGAIHIPATGITIKGEHHTHLEKIIQYKLSSIENEWIIPEPMARQYRQILALPEPIDTGVKDPISAESKPAREPKLARTSAPRPSKDGLITIQQIAQELNMEPGEARAILRKSNTPKPDAGWAWPQQEVAAIKKVLKS